MRRTWAVLAIAGILVTSLVAPATAESSVEWSREVHFALGDIATDHTGRIVLAGSKPSDGPGTESLWLRSLDASGATSWTVRWRPTTTSAVFATDVDVQPSDAIFATGVVWTPLDLDAPTAWFLRAYEQDGTLRWSRMTPGWQTQSASTTAGGVAAWDGGVVMGGGTCGEGGCYGGWVRSYRLGGHLTWTRSVGGTHGVATDITVAPTDRVYVTGAFKSSSGPPETGNHPFVTAFRSDGSRVWTYRFRRAEGAGVSIAPRRSGVVLTAIAASGTRAWLIALHDDGRLRWVRTSDRFMMDDVKVAPTMRRRGPIMVAGRLTLADGRHALCVRTYRPGGSYVSWTRDPGGRIRSAMLDVAHGTIAVGGEWGQVSRVWRLSRSG